jgi:uncharacterized membrane protein
MSVRTAESGNLAVKETLRRRKAQAGGHQHPVNVMHHDEATYILLNLAFSTQAAYTGPVLLLAGNRQSQKDRLTLEHAAEEADKADRQNVQILRAIEHNTEVTLQILKHVEQLVSEHVESSKS